MVKCKEVKTSITKFATWVYMKFRNVDFVQWCSKCINFQPISYGSALNFSVTNRGITSNAADTAVDVFIQATEKKIQWTAYYSWITVNFIWLFLCIPPCTGQGGVYPTMHWAWGFLPRGCLLWGCVSAHGGVYLWSQRGVCVADTPCEQNDTGVKALPCCNLRVVKRYDVPEASAVYGTFGWFKCTVHVQYTN